MKARIPMFAVKLYHPTYEKERQTKNLIVEGSCIGGGVCDRFLKIQNELLKSEIYSKRMTNIARLTSMRNNQDTYNGKELTFATQEFCVQYFQIAVEFLQNLTHRAIVSA